MMRPILNHLARTSRNITIPPLEPLSPIYLNNDEPFRHYYSSESASVQSVPCSSPSLYGKGTCQTILQWNCRGLCSSLPMLQEDIDCNDVQIAMLQELQTKYIPHLPQYPLPFYSTYTDPLLKTGIYVHETITHQHIHLNLIPRTKKEDVLYATAIMAYLHILGRRTPTILLNLYRSPNGHGNLSDYHQYLCQIRRWLTKGKINPSSFVKLHDVVIIIKFI